MHINFDYLLTTDTGYSDTRGDIGGNDYPQLAHRRGRFILRGTLCHYRKSTGLSSLRDAPEVLTISHRTALRLYGVINIKPLRGFFTANADNH